MLIRNWIGLALCLVGALLLGAAALHGEFTVLGLFILWIGIIYVAQTPENAGDRNEGAGCSSSERIDHCSESNRDYLNPGSISYLERQ